MSHHRVKRPCKICQQSVNNKTGLQCKGACRKWAHFTCLNYSASKVESIKTGELIVICPCPNCNTGKTKPPTSSSFTERHSISEVPASQCSSKIKCQNPDSGCGLPTCPVSPKASGSQESSQKQPEIPLCPHQQPEPPLNLPKDNLFPVNLEKRSATPPRPPKKPASLQSLKKLLASFPCPLKRSSSPPCPSKCPAPPALHSKRATSPPKQPASPPIPPNQFKSPPKVPPKRFTSPPKLLLPPLRPPKRPDSPPNPVEPYPVPPTPTPTAASVPPTVKGDCKRIILRKTKSCCCGVCKKDEILETSLIISSTSDISIPKSKEKQRMLYSNIKQLCNTVGLLSAQIKDMVARLVAGTD